MVFGLNKKDGKEQAGPQPSTAAAGNMPVPPQQPPPSLASLAGKLDADPYASDPVLSQMPRPSSLFEFGPMVQVGQDYMRGVCTGDDPDAIQACTWTIEEAEGKAKDKKHLYRVEF